MSALDEAVAAAERAAAACRPNMHRYDRDIDDFAFQAFAFARRRASADSADALRLGTPRTREELDAAAGETVTPTGLGEDRVLRLFTDVLEPACLSVDFPRYLAFVPAAPTETSVIADLVVSACSIYAGSWLEGGGAVWAENQALRWLADLAGLPEGAGGCFVSGGTMGNLSALVAAREAAATRLGRRPEGGWALVAGESSHSSVRTAASVMDVDLVVVPGERLTGAALAPELARLGERCFAVVATAGSTNLGVVDDLASVADAAADTWLHVDAAYGGAAMVAPSARPRFAGIERADSFVVDPHKWLFAPFDACAVLYRDPALARAAHTQRARYLDVLNDLADTGEWNPSDYAVHLSRRARGLPFWFSLAAYGTDAYAAAVETCLAHARAAAELVKASPVLDLELEPELSVVVFRRRGWTAADYQEWSHRMLTSGEAFVVPTVHAGLPALRLCIVNPRTTVADLRLVIDSLA
ncbi:MAG TPA: pyridoxal-dependent decarboxylase [Frankiaceae bacterium]|jgi:glutamate/tyrosine decarboxylase-like PLP-dependent enzyme|nr:pyridoxal-dependent decarboxylase [Frankiaceae bacterium]